ncbi:MAG: carboxypeptidase regulatory-like domain-containing protein [Planctomycetes bacterium]|nr:carboxypeptidase regulatory-like domain-containing protein [Planctomycetota bacterium]
MRTGLWKGICVAVVVPVLMTLAMPVRALMLDTGALVEREVPSNTALVTGQVTSLDSLPLPDLAVAGMDSDGNVIAMATTGPDGGFAMELPADAGRVIVLPAGGVPSEVLVKAGGTVRVNGSVPAGKVIGGAKPGWWAGMSTTSKAALIALPMAGAAGAGFALTNDGSTQHASPVGP